MMGDGAVIRVADGATIERPIHLVFVTTSDRPVSVFTRSLIERREGRVAAIIESHESADGVDNQVNHALECPSPTMADSITSRSRARAIARCTLRPDGGIGAQAHLNDFTFTAGGAVTRNQIAVRLNGTNTHAAIRGATLLKDRQHTDNTLVVDHAVGHCESRELFKAVLDGESRCGVPGQDHRAAAAQKTDAKMNVCVAALRRCRGRRQAGTEIFADDVVCGDGATAAALDDDLLFYLKARGIPQTEAEALRSKAFIGEAVETVGKRSRARGADGHCARLAKGAGLNMHPAVTNGSYDVARIREDFRRLSMQVYGKPLVYLDNAASAQKPKAVLDRIQHA